MTDEVRVGLCGWTISQATYVRKYRIVEVQHTFYEPPSDTLLRRWRLQAPSRLEFTIKAWQLVTHDATSPTYRRMKWPPAEEDRPQLGSFRLTPPVLAAWQRTLECAAQLRATAILLQCPRSFVPSEANITRLRTFATSAPRPDGVALMWEPRGDWPRELLVELCRDLDLVHVVDPMQTETVTPDRTYYRLHGTTGSRHVHTHEELVRLRALVADRPSPQVLFNNLSRVGDADRFTELL